MEGSKEKKEIDFLYNKHNKITKYKLNPLDAQIDFPMYISRILNKKTKRTRREQKLLQNFRKKVLYKLSLESISIERVAIKNRQKKYRETMELKNANDPTKIKHFGVWITKNDRLRINRENYVRVNKKNTIGTSFYTKYYHENAEIYNMFEDASCTTYSDEWCEKFRQKCLANYDLNMLYFGKLSSVDFNDTLNTFLKKNSKFFQVFDLNDVDNVSGIYLIVLDEFKQVYIGQSISIKRRILSHWSKVKEFDRLIYGDERNSILSIDSFGALDTTRIYVYETHDLFTEEQNLVDGMPSFYRLNRIGGGIGDSELWQIEAIATSNFRDLAPSEK